MRIRDYLKILKETDGTLEIAATPQPANNIQLLNIVRSIESLEKLKHIPIFEEDIYSLKQVSDIYFSKSDSIIVPQKSWQQFDRVFSKLKQQCTLLLKLLPNVLPAQDEYSISVLLPKYKDLDGLKVFIDKFNNILKNSILDDEINGKIELQNFDTGTLWIEIILGGYTAYRVIAAIAWSAAVVRKKKLEGDVTLQQVRAFEIKNDMNEFLVKKQKEQLDILVSAEAESIATSFHSNATPEKIEQLKMSIRELSILIDQGTRIEPALLAPEDAKNLLPDFNNLEKIESQIKQLTGKSDDE